VRTAEQPEATVPSGSSGLHRGSRSRCDGAARPASWKTQRAGITASAPRPSWIPGPQVDVAARRRPTPRRERRVAAPDRCVTGRPTIVAWSDAGRRPVRGWPGRTEARGDEQSRQLVPSSPSIPAHGRHQATRTALAATTTTLGCRSAALTRCGSHLAAGVSIREDYRHGCR